MSKQYAENLLHIQKYYPDLHKTLRQYVTEEVLFTLENSKSEKLTAYYIDHNNQQPLYMHSRYDPLEEARRWISSQVTADCGHVVFYGFGCGYMVEALLEIHPEIKISIYEPCPDLFKLLMDHRSLSKLINPRNTEFMAVEAAEKTAEKFIGDIVAGINKETKVLVLPAYQRLFPDKVKSFCDKFVEFVSNYKNMLAMNASAEYWWTINSMLNVMTVLESPNIFIKKEEFAGKPLIIASAGPSLEYEYNNLKYIRDNNMAYIFAVGSAVHGLIAKGILLHAFCSYDPWPANEKVFSSLNKSDFPLIFGTSIYSGTLVHHAGPKYHMVINQDTLSPFLYDLDTVKIIHDAPSIAVCTLQLAYKLGCNPIILVGQDLAFPNNKFYAEGINFNRPEQLNEQEKEKYFRVESVDGSEVLTSRSWDLTRKNMETFLRLYRDRHIYNTSRIGAKIENTVEKPLKEIMNELLKRDDINPAWYKNNQPIDNSHNVFGKWTKLHKSMGEFKVVAKSLVKRINRIGYNKNVGRIVQNEYDKILSEMNKFKSNTYYWTIIRPMVRVEAEIVNKYVCDIERENSYQNKAELIIKYFSVYINKIDRCILETEPIINSIKDNFADI